MSSGGKIGAGRTTEVLHLGWITEESRQNPVFRRYVRKPFDPEALVAVVKRIVQRS